MFRFDAKGKTGDPTLIGSAVIIEGSIRVEGPLQLNGRLSGVLIVEGAAAIGATGMVIGDVVANDLRVTGRVEGNVSVRDHLHVANGGCVRGDVRYGTLQVDRGGILAGTTVQGEDTISLDAELDEAATIPEPLPA